MNFVNERRMGTFSISKDFMEDNADACMAMMGACIIVRAELMYESNRFEYVAFSPHFDPIELGTSEAPYKPIFERAVDRDKNETVTFVGFEKQF